MSRHPSQREQQPLTSVHFDTISPRRQHLSFIPISPVRSFLKVQSGNHSLLLAICQRKTSYECTPARFFSGFGMNRMPKVLRPPMYRGGTRGRLRPLCCANVVSERRDNRHRFRDTEAWIWEAWTTIRGRLCRRNVPLVARLLRVASTTRRKSAGFLGCYGYGLPSQRANDMGQLQAARRHKLG